MSSEVLLAGLVKDFARLRDEGSDDEALQECPTLLSLEPVMIAAREGALRATALRALLETVAANDQEKDVRTGAALTGIAPPHIGRGVKLDRGAGDRDDNAGNILGRVGKTAYTHRLKYFRAYARAVMTYTQHASRYPDELAAYLRAVGLDESAISRAIERRQVVNGPRSSGQTALAAVATTPLGSPLTAALEAARTACEVANKQLFTPHVMLALLEMPRSKVARCFDVAQPRLAERLCVGLRKYIALAILDEEFPEFVPFDWSDRADIRRARELAAETGAATATDLHLLLSLLESESNTLIQLADLLGRDLGRVVQIANDMLGDAPQSRTPGSIPWTAYP